MKYRNLLAEWDKQDIPDSFDMEQAQALIDDGKASIINDAGNMPLYLFYNHVMYTRENERFIINKK